LRGDLSRFKNDFHLIGTHLRNASRCYDFADRKLQWFKDKLEQVESTSSQAELETASTKKETESDKPDELSI
jgi:DNA recombination protein RmuC